MPMLRSLVLALAIGCSTSHAPDTGSDASIDASDAADASVLDARELDAGVDAWVGPDAGPLEDPTLIVASETDSLLTFRWVKLDGRVERVVEHTMPDGHDFRSFAPSPDGLHGLFQTRRMVPDMPFVEQFYGRLIEWESGASLDLLELVRPFDPDGVCDRALGTGRWPKWRSDGRAVYLPCSIRELESGRLLEAVTFEIGLDGDVTRMDGACTGLAVATSDARAVVLTGTSCDDRRYALYPDGEFDLSPSDVVHGWYDGGVVVSTVTNVDGIERHSRVRWVAPDGPSETWIEDLPPGTFILPPSSAGDLPLAFREVPVTTSLSIRRGDGSWVRTGLPPCTSFGPPLWNTSWAPDARGFNVSCQEGDWIVRRDGGVRTLRLPASRVDIRWSPLSELILLVGSGAWSVNDSTTGEFVTIDHVDALDARMITWDREWAP